MLLGTLGTDLLENVSVGQEIMEGCEGTIRAGKNL